MTTHGQHGTRLYEVWHSMKKRCQNSNDTCYGRYGARGISVCDAWLAFVPFAEWARANGYDDSLTIDRIDNDGNYEPGNCRWITNLQQQRNRRSSRLHHCWGESKTGRAWAEDPRCVVPWSTLRERMTFRPGRNQMGIEAAMTKPMWG